MFGIVDRWYTRKKLRSVDEEPKACQKPEVLAFNRNKTFWLCFVPTLVSGTRLMRRGFIPRDGTVAVYTISSLHLIRPDPSETVGLLEEIRSDAAQRMRWQISEGCSINVLGVSLGNVLSIRLARDAKDWLGTLVSIVGGSKLGLSASGSILTGRIARKSGLVPEAYEQALSVFSPVNYIGDIIARKIMVRLGSSDLLIPYKYGYELALAFDKNARANRSQFDLRIYRGADHGSAMAFSGLENLFRSPWS